MHQVAPRLGVTVSSSAVALVWRMIESHLAVRFPSLVMVLFFLQEFTKVYLYFWSKFEADEAIKSRSSSWVLTQ